MASDDFNFAGAELRTRAGEPCIPFRFSAQLARDAHIDGEGSVGFTLTADGIAAMQSVLAAGARTLELGADDR